MEEKIINIEVGRGEEENIIKWEALEGADEYSIYRMNPGEDYQLVGEVVGGETKFVDNAFGGMGDCAYAIKYHTKDGWSDFIPEGNRGYTSLIGGVLLRVKSRLSVRRVFLGAVFLSIFYTLFVTNLEYVSNTKIILKETSNQPSANTLLAIMNPAMSNQRQNVKVVETYLYSRTMYKKLEKEFGLREYFSSGKINFYERVSEDSPIEDFLELYRTKVDFLYDVESDIIDIDFYHVDPKKAQRILEFINQELVLLINNLNKTTSEKKLKMVEGVIDNAVKSYAKQKRELEEFQTKYKTISPKDDLLKRVEITIGLEQEIERLDNEIKQKEIYMNKDHYEVSDLKKLKLEYEEKLANRVEGLIGVNKENVNRIINTFDELQAKLALQQNVLAEAMARQANINIEIQKENLILEIVTTPTLGEDYANPNKLHNVLLIIIMGFMWYFIFKVVYTIVREKKY